ncbi:MAG: hypothetical protein RL745_1005 [Actinomycetota bacterium]|jgi:D-alanyl-D-alanine carboxypeptidase
MTALRPTRVAIIALLAAGLAASPALAVTAAGPHRAERQAATAGSASRSMAPPKCALGDFATKLSGRKGYDAVLDTRLRLPKGWRPPSLARIAPGLQLQPAAADAWRAMRAKARADGVVLHPISAYRSEEYQRGLFARNVRQHGRAHALKFVARPGHSEHQLGLTLDIGYAPGTAITAEWSSNPRNRNQRAASWLTSRGWRFGWVRSYPKGKVDRTCYESEPWHWRYVGPAKASAVRNQGVTLREYLWGLQIPG